MKVLVFTSLYPNNIWPNHGVFTKERMASFSSLDSCSVRVVAPVPYFPPLQLGRRWKFSQVARKERIDALDIYHPRYFITPKVGMTLYGLTMFFSVLPLVRWLREDFDFELIEAHYVYPDGLAAVLLARYFHVPAVLFAEGSDINLYSNMPLIRKLLQFTLHRADRVVAVCQALKDRMELLGVPEEKIEVIHNGVDPKRFFPVPKQEARRKTRLPNGTIILAVGALIRRKGFDRLIRAFNVLARDVKGKDVYLVIIGEGEERSNLESLIVSMELNERVCLVGTISNRELYAWYASADLFCLTSSREGLPCVILEALACGTPVVGTSIWGVPEIIRSDKVGLLTGSSEREIADGMDRALSRSWDSAEIVSYARGHTWAQVADNSLHVFESVLDDYDKRYKNIAPSSCTSAQKTDLAYTFMMSWDL